MAWYNDLLGTTSTTFKIGVNHLIKAVTGGFNVRNAADSADGKIVVSRVESSGDDLLINSDAAGSANDWTLTLSRNSVQTEALNVVFPPAKGTDQHYLRQKASTSAGVLEFELAAVAGATNQITVDTTSLAFGTSSPLTLFSTPSGAIIEKVQVIIDTQFNGTPTLTVGISGTTSKYMTTTQNVLTDVAGTGYESNPRLPSTAGEALIATYSAGGASAGAARILVHYSIPS
jgi:hypothetical protein